MVSNAFTSSKKSTFPCDSCQSMLLQISSIINEYFIVLVLKIESRSRIGSRPVSGREQSSPLPQRGSVAAHSSKSQWDATVSKNLPEHFWLASNCTKKLFNVSMIAVCFSTSVYVYYIESQFYELLLSPSRELGKQWFVPQLTVTDIRMSRAE